MNSSILKYLIRDYVFGLALVAGPLFWAIMVWADVLVPDITGATRIPTPQLLMLVLLYPILEEIIFRKGIQVKLHQIRGLDKGWAGITRANALTSLLFSCFHLLYQIPNWAAAVFFPSLFFGFFRDKYGSILPSIILHIYYNAGFFILFNVAR